MLWRISVKDTHSVISCDSLINDVPAAICMAYKTTLCMPLLRKPTSSDQCTQKVGMRTTTSPYLQACP